VQPSISLTIGLRKSSGLDRSLQRLGRPGAIGSRIAHAVGTMRKKPRFQADKDVENQRVLMLMNKDSKSTIFPATRVTLLARLKDPAARAWDDFFVVYGPVIYRMARHARLDEHAAEDIVAIVMRNFVGSMASGFEFDPERGRFRNYLRTITNRSIRQLRRSDCMGNTGNRVDLALEQFADDDEAPDAAWEQFEREERWQACLDRLRESSIVSPRDFEAFVALVLKGEGTNVVAHRFGVTTNRLHGIKHSVIRRLRQIREELDAELGEV